MAAISQAFLAAKLAASEEFQKRDRFDWAVKRAGTEKLPKFPAVLGLIEALAVPAVPVVPVVPVVPAVLDWRVLRGPPFPAIKERYRGNWGPGDWIPVLPAGKCHSAGW